MLYLYKTEPNYVEIRPVVSETNIRTHESM